MSKREKLMDCASLMAEWDYDKNELNPLELTVGSSKMAWWICEKNHSWEAMIRNRGNGTACPYCTNRKVLVGFNDLQTVNSILAREWDDEKNKLTPLQVTYGSAEIVWWKCDEGHSWKAAVSDRSKGGGCPVCHNKKVLAGFNDLQTLNPELAKEWAHEKNKLLPSQVTPGSEKKVWWKCSLGHFWEALVCHRNAGTECPYCTGYSVLAGFNDLQTLRPELAKQWDSSKNELMPSQITLMSNRLAWWICEKGHSWEAEVSKRSIGGKCPYCEGHRALAGFNDLQTLRPDLVIQWHPEKNVIAPSQVTLGSGKKAWWKCGEGHSWKARVCSRVKGVGCPYCAKRRIHTGFNDLQKSNPKLSLEWDSEKNRLAPSQVSSGTTEKAWWKCDKGHSWEAQIASRNRGAKCPYCTGRLLLPSFNDLQTRRPDIAVEWDHEKNVLMPSQVAVGSNKLVWWRCKEGHSWKATVNCRSHKGKRRKSGSGCPYCAKTNRKVLPGFNDLQTVNPRLANEWDTKKNTLSPSQVTVASGKYAWWKCRKYGHSWRAQIAGRSVSNHDCPYCSGQRVLKGFNDLKTLEPGLANEWYNKRNRLKPSQVTRYSGKKVWWKCQAKGHLWKAAVYDRTRGSDCPHCLGTTPYVPRCVK